MNLEIQWSRIFGTQRSISLKIYSNIGLPQETRKTSNKQQNLIPKGIRKRTNKTQSE